METKQNNEIEIDLKQIFFLLLSRAWVIITVGVLCALLAFAYFSFIADEEYTSTTQIYIMDTESQGTINNSDVAMYSSLLNDCLQIIKTNPVMEQVIAELGLDMTAKGLSGKISASKAGDSRIISISVVDGSPVVAKRIADAVAIVSSDKIEEVVGKKIVNVVQPANMPTSPSAPATLRNTLLVFMLGAVAVSAVIIIRHIVDDTIKVAEDIERHLGITVIGTIPMFGDEIEEKNKSKKKGKNNEVRKPRPMSEKVVTDDETEEA